MKLKIGYFYPQELNLYGDNGNVEILVSRARARNIDVEVLHITPEFNLTSKEMSTINLVFMGGGPDSSQKVISDDFLNNKGKYLQDYIELGGVGLYICGSYQLLGKYYKPATGPSITGLGVFNLFTQHFGNHKPRCIGNVVCKLNADITSNPLFKAVNFYNTKTLVGFENHGGRTYLTQPLQALGKVKKGNGNNSEDGTEGYHYKNSFGSYFHGPILSRNPHFADYLIAESLQTMHLPQLDDSLIYESHSASLGYK